MNRAASPRRAGRPPIPVLLLPFLVIACLVGQVAPSPVAPTLPPPQAAPTSTGAPPQTLPTETEPPPAPTATAPPTATLTPTPGPTPLPVFGVELSALEAAYGLSQAQAAGAHWARRAGVWWPDVEPVQGTRNWAALARMEQEFLAASGQGLQAIIVVRGTPEWAQALPGRLCGPVRSDQLGAFASFVGELVGRYSVEPYNVKYWEIWNEPDIDPNLVALDSLWGCWGDANDPYYGGGYYAEALKAVYPAVKAANPEASVLVGGLLLDCDPVAPPPDKDCTPSRFLEGILSNGGGPFFDGVSFHAYDYAGTGIGRYGNGNWHSAWNTTGPVVSAKANYLKSLLQQFGASDKFLMNTESAVLCGRTGDEPQCQTPEAAETKAYYVAQAYGAAIAAGLRANIWYNLTGWRGSGLTDPSLNPLPAYDAYRFAAEELRSAVFVRALAEFPGVAGYEFVRDGRRIWLVWSLDGEPHALSLPELPQSLFDVYGQAQTPAAELEIGPAPLYLEWAQPG